MTNPYQPLWEGMVHAHRDHAPFTEAFQAEFFVLLERLSQEKLFHPDEVASTYAAVVEELQSLNRAATAIESQVRSLSYDAKSAIHCTSLDLLSDDAKRFIGQFTTGIDNPTRALFFLVQGIALPMLKAFTEQGVSAIRASRLAEHRTHKKARVAAVLYHLNRLYQSYTGNPIRRVSQDTSLAQIPPWLLDIVQEVVGRNDVTSAIDHGLRALRRYRPTDLHGTPTALGYEEMFALIESDEISARKAEDEKREDDEKSRRRENRIKRRAHVAPKIFMCRQILTSTLRQADVAIEKRYWPIGREMRETLDPVWYFNKLGMGFYTVRCRKRLKSNRLVRRVQWVGNPPGGAGDVLRGNYVIPSFWPLPTD